MPKIFFIGDFKKSYSTEVYIAHGLRECGAEVIEWQEETPAQLDFFCDYVVSEKPDFILCSKNRIYTNGKLFLRKMREAKIPTVSWLFDLYLNLPKEMGISRTVHDSPFYCDYVFMSDGGEHAEMKHVNRFLLRQGIYEPEAVYGRKFNFRPEVAFIGSDTYKERHELIEYLRYVYADKFVHYGIGGNAPETRGMKLNDVLATVKVVVGDSVPSDKYWSNRVYEILGRGGFLLHPKVNGLEQEFQYYKHLIPFDYGNHAQVREIVDYYLEHDKEREDIRKAGFQYCKDNYTYKIRCQTLLQKVIGMIEQKNMEQSVTVS